MSYWIQDGRELTTTWFQFASNVWIRSDFCFVSPGKTWFVINWCIDFSQNTRTFLEIKVTKRDPVGIEGSHLKYQNSKRVYFWFKSQSWWNFVKIKYDVNFDKYNIFFSYFVMGQNNLYLLHNSIFNLDSAIFLYIISKWEKVRQK